MKPQMRSIRDQNRLSKLILGLWVAIFLLAGRVLVAIIAEYSNYFPPNFNSDFLLGRQSYFWGSYSTAFYAHIVISPIAIILAAMLMWTGRRPRSKFAFLHRQLGKVQAVLIVGIVVPTGLVMSLSPIAGPIAGAGFATLSIALLVTIVVAVREVRRGNISQHQIWATRCFILLCSPLLLRLLTGVTIVTGLQSPLAYQMSAWFSWMVPLLGYEAVCWVKRPRNRTEFQRVPKSLNKLN